MSPGIVVNVVVRRKNKGMALDASISYVLDNNRAVADSFAEKLKQGAEELALKMEYMPNSVSKLDNGGRRISFTAEEVIKGGAECSLQLYGYFVGTSMDYRVVRANLMKMWRSYGIVDITKTNSGIFYFKFKSEEGMKNVLESGPWMVQNIPLVLNLWEPGIWLEKVEPSTIPIWACVYNIPMELCNGGSIGKIMSGIGKPLLMDNMTKERCLKKAGKLDFARVLVEVSADDELPNVLEIAYPPIGNSPAKIGKLDVKYQWKPPLCTHCKTFGHSTLACKVRPRTEEEKAASILKETLKVSAAPKDTVVSSLQDDGFIMVGRNNKSIDKKQFPLQATPQVKQGFRMQNRSSLNTGRQFGNGGYKSGYQGNSGQTGKWFKKQGVGGNDNGKPQDGIPKKKVEVRNSSMNDKPSDAGEQKKSLRELSHDPNFKPKVLVRGSGSKGISLDCQDEVVPVSNLFDVLSDEVMNEEFDNVIWPKLKGEVDDVMENGIYPSKEIRAEWSLRQMEYFYNNCHKFHLDPNCEDEEEDVNSEVDGIASDMKPEYEAKDVDILENEAAINQNVQYNNR
ncbi:RNA-directed DNA polymerase, eukaryota, reverse transcriptase zinc-binding domain protein [Tanacetum coccineum]